MSGRRRRLAMAATLTCGACGLAGMAGCEALVGIHEKDLAPETTDGPSSAEAGDELAVLGDGTSQPDGRGSSKPDGTTGGDTSAGGDDGAGGEEPGMDVVGPVDSRGGGDVGPVGDGGDAGPPMDPDVPCAQQPPFLYCNDFDSVATVGATWDYTYDSFDAGASIQFDTVDFVSSPHSVEMIAPLGLTGDLQLGKDVGILSNDARLAFDVRVDTSSLAGLPQIVATQMYLARATGTIQINFVIGPGSQSALNVFGVTDASAAMVVPITVPTPMAWERIAIGYDSAAGISVYKNGVLQGTLVTGPGAPGDTKVILGSAFIGTGGTQTVTMEEDNIVVSGH